MQRDLTQTRIAVHAVQQGPDLDVIGMAAGRMPELGTFPTILLNAGPCPELLGVPISDTLPERDKWPIRSRVTPALRLHGIKFQVEIAPPYEMAFSFYLCPCLGPAWAACMGFLHQTGCLIVTALAEADVLALELDQADKGKPHGGLVLPVDLAQLTALAEVIIEEQRYN